MKKKVLKVIKAKSRCGACVSRAVSARYSTDAEEIAERIREYGRKLAKDPAAARAMLIRTGMYDSEGKLKKEYR